MAHSVLDVTKQLVAIHQEVLLKDEDGTFVIGSLTGVLPEVEEDGEIIPTIVHCYEDDWRAVFLDKDEAVEQLEDHWANL
jgi:hypothetical protein